MQTILDNCESLYCGDLLYHESLKITVYEVIVSKEKLDMRLENSDPGHSSNIESPKKGRSFKIEFEYERVINFQVIQESYDTVDENEINDSLGYLRIVKNSKYSDYVRKNHGWYKDIHEREADHYRICTRDEIIDVICLDPPLIEEIKDIY